MRLFLLSCFLCMSWCCEIGDSPLKIVCYSIASPSLLHIKSIETMDYRWSIDGVSTEEERRINGISSVRKWIFSGVWNAIGEVRELCVIYSKTRNIIVMSWILGKNLVVSENVCNFASVTWVARSINLNNSLLEELKKHQNTGFRCHLYVISGSVF